jgi:hypothetical protein
MENKFGVPLGLSPKCILQPQSAHKFRVTPRGLDKEVSSFITQQVIDAKMDFVKKYLIIRIRASVLEESLSAVMSFSESSIAPLIEALDGGNDKVLFSLHFQRSKLIRHEFNFSYENSGILMHDMEWSFNSVSLRP